MSAPEVRGDRLAVIVGSGLQAQDIGATEPTSAMVVRGEKDSATVEILAQGDYLILSRHGVAKPTPAHRLDHFANIRAICEAGCNRVLSLCSTGSLRTDWPVGTIVAPADFVGPSFALSFFDDARGHIVPSLDQDWRRKVVESWRRTNERPLIDSGVYAQTRGPRLETPAEIRMLATHADIVGMTMVNECVLAQEVGLAYMAICSVDNLANGIGGQRLDLDIFRRAIADNRDRLGGEVQALIEEIA